MEWWRHLVRQSMRLGAIGFAVLLLIADMGLGAWVAACSGVVVVALALLDIDLRTRVAAALGASAVTDVVTVAGVNADANSFGLAEAAGLGLLLVLATRLLPTRTGQWAVPALAVAVLVLPLRLGESQEARAGVMFVLAVCVAMAVALGGLLRAQDTERRAAIDRVRSDERLSLARDLHDSVAHHVTGIVVRAQAAQVVAADDPDDAVAALAAIEREGVATLQSMRRLVGVLREDDAERQPPAGLAQIRDVVARFTAGGARATLTASPEAAGADLPDEVGAAAHRIVQESLTNVHRHAVRPTRVAVELDVIDGALQIRVRDDGRVIATQGAGGFGLVGLHERVQALGGRMAAGPMTGGGWEVAAALPLGTAAGAGMTSATPLPSSALPGAPAGGAV